MWENALRDLRYKLRELPDFVSEVLFPFLVLLAVLDMLWMAIRAM